MPYRYENLYIMHYGVGHDKGGHSGRYPWGSGENPYGGKGTRRMDLASNAAAKARAIRKAGMLTGPVGMGIASVKTMDYEEKYGVSPSSGIRQLSEKYKDNEKKFYSEVKSFIKNNKEQLDDYLKNARTYDRADIDKRFSDALLKSYNSDKKLFDGITSLNNLRKKNQVDSLKLIENMADDWDFKTLYDSKHLIDSKKNINRAKSFIDNAYSKALMVTPLADGLLIPSDVYYPILNTYYKKTIATLPSITNMEKELREK